MAGDLVPLFSMAAVQVGFAGMNIISKIAMDSGMDPFVHVAYRQIVATLALLPLAYFFDRKTRPKMSGEILFLIFLCSIFGVTVNQITYIVGLKYSTPTIACALANISPAVTYLIALPLRLERLGLRSKAGLAKVLGTGVCVGGALLLSFYHGSAINVGHFQTHHRESPSAAGGGGGHANLIMGPFLLVLSAVSFSIWLIIQSGVNRRYNAPFSTSAMMCLMASFECVIAAVCFDGLKPSAWGLSPYIRVLSCAYSGVVCSALAYCVMSWCVDVKGPLYVSVFSPLMLVVVAILSWGILGEKLYLGTLMGSILIVLGVYGVLWGNKEEATAAVEVEDDIEK
ncbi:hypothetical protein M569_09355 [Genlisea aurea]|uniref:WAT1-related protein n=1 Tax=Genlisea aurea TaxID=192259 RepID=S8DZH6_9LAMI|nr:hypothetical protein M569_09355 [Genlisea aurea]